MNLPTVDIVTVSFRNAEHFPSYIEALCHLAYPPDKLKLIMVDNGSTDGAVPLLRQLLPELPFASELIECGENLGFSGGCNCGAFYAHGDYILFLNPDTQVEADTVRKLTERAIKEPRLGLIEAAQYPEELDKWFDPQTGETDWCSGACILAKRTAFNALGGFDTFFYPAYCEDVDLSWRMWLGGWRCVYETQARVRHDTKPEGPKPVETYYTVKFSFAMHFIYDSKLGLVRHLIRGARYLASPRTEKLTRSAVCDGLLMIIRRLPALMSRRCRTQAALKKTSERARFVFTEWFYGRFRNKD